jgi:cytochrome c-type biogenesis protein CcmE
VNKRARNRLIGVTAIVLIAVVAILLGAGSKDGAYYRQVSDIANDPELVGERVKVGGEVVAGSWDKQSNPMRFEIREEGVDDGDTIKVVYTGGVPSTFGDGVVAILTGTLSDDGTLESDDMITKCPSKYESAAGALTVSALAEKGDAVVGKYTKVTGAVAAGTIVPPGEDVRFVIVAEEGTEELGVFYEGALPEGMDDGSAVVIGGTLLESGVFEADSVAISEESQ